MTKSLGDMSEPISQSWYKASAEWVDLEAAASMLEESKSAVLSQWMYEEGDIPVSRAEANVKASDRWADYIKKMVNARTQANKAKIKAEFWKMRFWENQSKDANHRIEAKL